MQLVARRISTTHHSHFVLTLIIAGAMSVFSAIILWWILGSTFKWTLYLSGFLTLGHALFRDSLALQNQNMYSDPMIIPSDAGFYQGPQIVGA